MKIQKLVNTRFSSIIQFHLIFFIAFITHESLLEKLTGFVITKLMRIV